VRVGDLVKYESALNDSMDHYTVEYGLVIKMSKTGHDTTSAQVLFKNEDPCWMDTRRLVVVSESR